MILNQFLKNQTLKFEKIKFKSKDFSKKLNQELDHTLEMLAENMDENT